VPDGPCNTLIVGFGSVRGGAAPVDKGAAGVDQAARALEARGYTVEGGEVTFDTAGGRVRADLVVRDADGNLYAVEAKTGARAKMSANQVSAYRAP
jgi:hypothetical protein